jgi:hypothetical protein
MGTTQSITGSALSPNPQHVHPSPLEVALQAELIRARARARRRAPPYPPAAALAYARICASLVFGRALTEIDVKPAAGNQVTITGFYTCPEGYEQPNHNAETDVPPVTVVADEPGPYPPWMVGSLVLRSQGYQLRYTETGLGLIRSSTGTHDPPNEPVILSFTPG